MKKFALLTLAGIMASAAPSFAETFSVLIANTAVTALSGNASPIVDDVAVDATGRIIFADRATSSNENIVRFDSNGTNGVLVKTVADIITAVEAVNGTSTQSAVTIRGIDVAADGDIIVLSDGSGAQTGLLLSIDPTTFAVTVLCCSKDASVSTVEGSGVLKVIGNTAYVGYEGSFGGPAGDAVVAVDTNDTVNLPNIPSTIIAGPAALEAVVTGLLGPGSLNLGPITSTPSGDLIVADSNGSGTTDDLILIDLPSGTPSLLVDNTDTIADFSSGSVTDIGYGGLAVVPSGTVYGADNFGSPNTDTGRGIAKLESPGAGIATGTLLTNGQFKTDTGGTTTPSLGRAVYDSTSSRVLFANSSGDRQGIIAMSLGSGVSSWDLY